jgi:hypothetical protein
MNWNSSVGIACWVIGKLAFYSEKGRDFSLFKIFHTSCGAHQASYPIGTGISFSEDKTVECEADLSPPSTAKIQNVLSYTSFLSQYVFMT